MSEGAAEEARSTLYVKNVNEKLSRDEARRNLAHLFGRHGRVISVHMQKRNAMRGQAFVTFASAEEAQKALNYLQDHPFFGKNIAVSLALKDSSALFLFKGVYMPRRRKAPSLYLLRVENLPLSVTQPFLEFFFKQEEGYVALWHIPGSGECLIEFRDEESLLAAQEKFQGHLMDENNLKTSRVTVLK